MFLKLNKIDRESPVPRSPFYEVGQWSPAALLKRNSNTDVACEFCEIFNNNFFFNKTSPSNCLWYTRRKIWPWENSSNGSVIIQILWVPKWNQWEKHILEVTYFPLRKEPFAITCKKNYENFSPKLFFMSHMQREKLWIGVWVMITYVKLFFVIVN